MTKFKKYILLTVFFLFSQSLFADTNPFAQTFSDIDKAQNIFLSDLKHEAKKQAEKKSLEIARLEKVEKSKKIRSYIQRRIAEYDAYEKSIKQQSQPVINANQNLKVTATAYTSHTDECKTNPMLGAWNNRLVPGSKSIAVSQDLLKKYGMKNGTKVHISGLSGTYRVVDTMHERYTKRIDIYMGMDKNRAKRWGEKNVVIYWD